MCNPTALMIAGTGLQIGSQISAGRTAEANARLEAADMDYQAAMERDNASLQARSIRREGRAVRGQVLGSIVASGVKVGEGSALDAERDVMTDSETDAELAILRGEQTGRGLNTRATLTRMAGRQARRAANLQAFNTLLSAGAQGMKASGWRANGPGWSNQQAPAPVIDKSTRS
jgi:hypothetical protein